MVTERPILFSGEMVRAILAGRKNQTRRIVKPQPDRVWRSRLYGSAHFNGMPHWDIGGLRLRDCADNPLRCPYGQPGDMLWLREKWQYYDWTDGGEPCIRYAADNAVAWPNVLDDEWGNRIDDIWAGLSAPENTSIDGCARDRRWRSSIHMPRWASRITLEIVGHSAEWLNDISEADAMAEGAEPLLVPPDGGSCPHVEGFRALWESINGPGSWEANPLVWRIEFRRV